MQVRSSSSFNWSAFTDIGLRWSRINSCSSANIYNPNYYFSLWPRQEIKCWGTCWWSHWRVSRLRNFCWRIRLYNRALSQATRINSFHIHCIWITTNYDEWRETNPHASNNDFRKNNICEFSAGYHRFPNTSWSSACTLAGTLCSHQPFQPRWL